MASQPATYTHGHHASVLRSHTWRTAQNSCAYLLRHLSPSMKILDIGCGPGTITADLAEIASDGHVTAVDSSPAVLEQASSFADSRGIKNITFTTADIHALEFPDNSFDVVHAHQVLQHVGDPILALKEMHRVTKPGGIVAAKDSDYEAFTWYPDTPGLKDWKSLYLKVARKNGGEPNAGRQLHAWARVAGLPKEGTISSASTWCYNSPEERAWWSDLWAERILESRFAESALENGLATQEELEKLSQVWRQWGKEEDAWFVILHGEILCKV